MINLIPNQEKKKMIANFRFRLLVILLTALTVTAVVGSVALLPAYFFTSVKKEIAENKLAEQRKTPTPELDQNTLSSIEELNSELKLLGEDKQNRLIVTEKILNEIILKKAPEIKINQIAYESDSLGEKTVSVRGSAPSRESLLAFRFTLENNPNFKNINLPISNFIKGSNIQFFLTLSPIGPI